MWALLLLLSLRIEPVDLYSETARTAVREQVRRACQAVDADSIGPAWVRHFQKLGASTDGKQAYVGFLKDRYGYTITRFNEAYGVDFQSFTDLETFTFDGVDANRPAPNGDSREFIAALREIAARVSAEGLRGCGGAPKR
ncbi:MAG: hypothetical protein FJW40_07105 [Acidobacteria bacterium]|nr:hypothetical protein [Acidobacteriota bacterium]